MSRTSVRLKLGAFVAASAAALTMAAPWSGAASGEPTRILVFSKPYAFAHTSIPTFSKLIKKYDGNGEFTVKDTTDPSDLNYDNLEANYDVLIWNNSTGDVPLSPDNKAGMLKWIREGHGFVGIHSAADSNYGWPQFIELAGGLFQNHYYDFGGMTTEPQTEILKNEDPGNPMVSHIPLNWPVSDETYRWQVDPRPDVHVLLSLENTSVAEGAIYYQNEPLAWCRPFGQGRTFYVNLGHSDYMYINPTFVQMVMQSIRYAAGTLPADCSVPGASGRQEAVWSDASSNVTPAVSTDTGGMAVDTKLTPGTSTITWNAVDLTGLNGIDVRLGSMTIGAPSSGGTVPPSKPTSGGTVNFHLDSATGPVIASADFPAPGTWNTVSAPTTAVTGVHDLVLTFDAGAASAASGLDGLGQTDLAHDGSLAWIRLVKPTN
jgi:type 1 glutamine amidotransferase